MIPSTISANLRRAMLHLSQRGLVATGGYVVLHDTLRCCVRFASSSHNVRGSNRAAAWQGRKECCGKDGLLPKGGSLREREAAVRRAAVKGGCCRRGEGGNEGAVGSCCALRTSYVKGADCVGADSGAGLLQRSIAFAGLYFSHPTACSVIC